MSRYISKLTILHQCCERFQLKLTCLVKEGGGVPKRRETKFLWLHCSDEIHWPCAVTIFEPPHDKTSKMSVRPAKTQINLDIRPVWSESSLCAPWVAKDPSFLHADSEASDQTGRMPRLIWVFAGRTATLLVLSCRVLVLSCRDSFFSLICGSVLSFVFYYGRFQFGPNYSIWGKSRKMCGCRKKK